MLPAPPPTAWAAWPPNAAPIFADTVVIECNCFDDIAGHAVVGGGDSNRVTLDNPSDTVRDLGAGNKVDWFVGEDKSVEELRHQERLVAVVRTTTSTADGEQAFITLFAGGAASGLVVVSFEGGRLFGTTTPDTWAWVDEDTVEVCGPTIMLRNEVGFAPRSVIAARFRSRVKSSIWMGTAEST